MKKILFSIMAVALAIGLVGGAFAYFSDVEYSDDNVFQAGTLDFQIADINEPYGDAVVTASLTASDLAPGQTFMTAPISFYNAGSMDIYWIFARFGNLVLSDPDHDIADKIILQSYEESGDGGTTWASPAESFIGDNGANANAYIDFWNGVSDPAWNPSGGAGIAHDGSISLRDLFNVRDYGSGDHKSSLLIFDGGNLARVPVMQHGQYAAVRFTFKFAEDAGNVFQGDSVTFDIDFIASANHDYPDNTLIGSGLETLSP